jgi:hypothetical protein
MLETFNMGGEDGVVHETPQEQRERERELLTPKGATTGLELKELLALVAISVVVVVVTLVLML